MTAESPTPESQDDNQNYKPRLSFPAFLQMVAGLLIAMGMVTLGTEVSPVLLWTPVALVVAALAFLMWPRPKKKPMVFNEPTFAKAVTPPPASTPTEVKAEEKPAEPEKPAAPKKPAGPIDKNTVLVLWGSETGTAEGLADMVASRLNEAGTTAQSVSLGDMTLDQLAGFAKVLLLTSTWGDGEPPSNAIDIHEAMQKGSADLSSVHYSVLSLGDTAYPEFCQCGKDFDAYFEKFGAKRVHPRVDCDLDYEGPFEKWYTGVSKAMQGQLSAV